MEQESFNVYFNEILDNYADQENTNRIIEITNHVSFLELLLNFLANCPRNNKLSLTFKTIALLLQNRGSLLNREILEYHINNLLHFIASCADFVASSHDVLLFCSDAVAYFYRFIFELSIQDEPAPFEILFDLYSENNQNLKIVALSIMKCVVSAIKNNNFKHISEVTRKENVITFQKTHLHAYFQVAAKIILSNEDNDPLIDYALELLISCFQIYSNKDDYKDLDTYSFIPPSEISQYYQNPSDGLPMKLLHLFEISKPGDDREKYSMECLMYFASVKENIWQQSTRISFLIFLARNITELIDSERCQSDASSLLVTSRLIYKCAIGLPVVNFFVADQQVAVNFFIAVSNLTVISFNLCLMEEQSNYLIKFWSQIIASRFPPNNVPQEFMGLFPKIFNEYIEALGNNDDESIIQSVEKIVMSQYIESSKYLWQIASVSPRECAESIASALDQSTDTLLENPLDESSKPIICKMIYLILIISAQFANLGPTRYQDQEAIDQNIILIICIYNYIAKTNDFIASIYKAALESDKETQSAVPFTFLYSNCEKTLIFFTEKISRDFFFKPPTKIPEIILNGLSICGDMNLEGRKQFVFDMLFNRFLCDIKNLDDPELVYELLKFIGSSIFKGSNEYKLLPQNNELLQSLVQREDNLEFTNYSDGVSISQLYKLYKTLNQLYVRSIHTVEQFEAFLPYFDDRFSTLQSSNYSDEDTVFVLYSELHGVFNGNGNIYHFSFMFRWFMFNHVDDTINCITAHGDNLDIVETIAKAWKSLCSNKGNKLVLKKTSAEGIRLFQCSLGVVNALMSTKVGESDSIKKVIIKIIQPSVSSKNIYVNFGIMEYFKDQSFDTMIENFFRVISDIQVQIDGDKKLINLVNLIIQSIILIKPSLIDEGGKLELITRFLDQAASNEAEIKSIIDIFETLASFMELFIGDGESTEVDLSHFKPHFVRIIDLLINFYEGVLSDKVSPAIYYMLAYGSDLVNDVFEQIYSLFDENNRREVVEIFEATFSIDLQQSKDIATKQLRTNLTKIFKNYIMKYSINIYEIEEFYQMSIF